jgi:hypothetical protein
MAMPSQLQTPDVILQLNALANESGISFDQIQPTSGSATTSATGVTEPFATEPISVKFSGSFYNLLTFLQRMRNLVRVENGRLYTAGRLFDVSNVEFSEGKAWPQISATLTINAFVPQPAQPLSTTTPGATGTTSTTTTGTTTTSNSTSAAPSTSGGTS